MSKLFDPVIFAFSLGAVLSTTAAVIVPLATCVRRERKVTGWINVQKERTSGIRIRRHAAVAARDLATLPLRPGHAVRLEDVCHNFNRAYFRGRRLRGFQRVDHRASR